MGECPVNYKREFAANWKPLSAATIGMGLGLALHHYVMSLFAPEMIREFGWSKAKYALVGATPFVSMLLIPFCGRLTDRVGPRIAATIGFLALPLGYMTLSFLDGNFALFLLISMVNSVLGVLTTTLVFARVVVERFDKARGIALSIVMSGAPLAGAIAVPFIAEIIDTQGWRAGFRALALISAVGGAVAITLLGRARHLPKVVRAKHVAMSRSEIATLFRQPVFGLAMAGMFLINLPQTLAALQLKLMLQDNGASNQASTWIVSLYAAGVVVGRI
jgi:MFS family permease